MPIYEYRCENCGFQKEHLQKMDAPELTTCPSCSQAAYKKLISASSFQLKGDGWYKSSPTPPSPQPETKGCCDGCACHSG